MFTGIIEELGSIRRLESAGTGMRIHVGAKTVLEGVKLGDSIAVDGACLTVERHDDAGFTAFASLETMRKTTLGDRTLGDPVNLERALSFGARLGGHLVSGHIDATGTFHSARQEGEAWEVWFHAPPEILRSTVAKGSIAVDGISLTVVDLTDQGFSVWVIPETWTRTTLGGKRPGARVNLESDLIGKYVARLLGGYMPNRDGKLEELLRGGSWGSG
jgi:riboflavin synthase